MLWVLLTACSISLLPFVTPDEIPKSPRDACRMQVDALCDCGAWSCPDPGDGYVALLNDECGHLTSDIDIVSERELMFYTCQYVAAMAQCSESAWVEGCCGDYPEMPVCNGTPVP